MLDQHFCETLEYKLCAVFKNSDSESLKGFWCDGVVLPTDGKYYSQQFVNDNRYVAMQAFIGKDGQTVYSLTLRFGKKALSHYARNLSIIACIPKTDPQNWCRIDTTTKEIEILLD
jgi:hypothetical protein